MGADLWLAHGIVDTDKKECWHLFLRDSVPEAVGIAHYIVVLQKTWIYENGKPVESTAEELNSVLMKYVIGVI